MSRGRLIVACDFGTTTFRALVTELLPSGELEFVSCSELPSAGFADGDFVDLRLGSRCIARLLQEVETAAEIDISGFTYNIAGSHLRSVWARGQVQIGPGPRVIKNSDLDAVLAKARSLVIPFDNWILAVNPVEYAVDRVKGIIDPRGRIGSQLEVEAHLITGSRSVVRNVELAIETAGFDVAGRAVEILGTAYALLSAEEREHGVLLIDVGGQVTNWAVFRNGRIAGNGTVPWGGCTLTSDLAHGLRVSAEEAEAIKCEQGVVLRSLEQDVSTAVLFEEACPEITPGLIAAILEPRLEEVFSLVKNDMRDSRPLSTLGAGVVLTGGGSRCRGSVQLCDEVFDMPVTRRHEAAGLSGGRRLSDGQWATAAGLSIWAAGAVPAIDSPPDDRRDTPVGFFDKLSGIFRRGRSGGENISAET